MKNKVTMSKILNVFSEEAYRAKVKELELKLASLEEEIQYLRKENKKLRVDNTDLINKGLL